MCYSSVVGSGRQSVTQSEHRIVAVEVYVVGPIEKERDWFTEHLVFVCWSDIMCGPTRYSFSSSACCLSLEFWAERSLVSRCRRRLGLIRIYECKY